MHHHVHLGVTGLRRTGKTVFLTSLIYQLEQLGCANLPHVRSNDITLMPGRVESSTRGEIEPFPYFTYLQKLRQKYPAFPPATDREYGCVLRLKYENRRTKSKVDRAKHWIGLGNSHGTISLHLHDYPGEYLLDVGLLKMSYRAWSDAALDRMRRQRPSEAADYEQAAKNMEGKSSGEVLQALRGAYAQYALAARSAGLELIQPAMALLEWFNRREAGSSAAGLPQPRELPFVPLPREASFSEPFIEEMRESYEGYRTKEIRPFVKRIQRCRLQLVLVDVLRVLRNGVDAYNDTRRCLADILRAYHDTWRPFTKVRRVLFAATKADHATRNHRANMTRLLDDLVGKAKGDITSGINVPSSEYFTSYRATQDGATQLDGHRCDVLHGLKKGHAQHGNYFPGTVPQDWPDGDWTFGNTDFDFPEFEPRQLPRRDGANWPHMNLDRVIWRILEDCF